MVISHGGGGFLCQSLRHGTCIGACRICSCVHNHAGDTYDDQSKVLQLWRRLEQLRVIVSYMLRDWPQHERLVASRIGAFGFSNGGFAVLVQLAVFLI